MQSFSENWESIKQKTWLKFSKQQILIDEQEHVIVMKRRNGKIVVAGFLFSFVSTIHYIDSIFDFIDYLRKMVDGKWNNPEIILITNYRLSEISSDDYNKIINLPSDITYYLFKYGGFEKMDIKSENDFSLSRHQSEINFYRNRENREKEPIDDESIIMNALLNGYGDRFGF